MTIELHLMSFLIDRTLTNELFTGIKGHIMGFLWTRTSLNDI